MNGSIELLFGKLFEGRAGSVVGALPLSAQLGSVLSLRGGRLSRIPLVRLGLAVRTWDALADVPALTSASVFAAPSAQNAMCRAGP